MYTVTCNGHSRTVETLATAKGLALAAARNTGKTATVQYDRTAEVAAEPAPKAPAKKAAPRSKKAAAKKQ